MRARALAGLVSAGALTGEARNVGESISNGLIAALEADLRDEASSLLTVLEAASPEDWHSSTPAVGWTVHDQVAHLANFDNLTRLSVESPDAFITLRDSLLDLQIYIDGIGAENAWRDGVTLLRWWREENDGLRAAALAADPSVRVPWFGPSMSVASKVTARIMETWAHGQDIADTLGIHRPPTDRLKHVARIGVLAFPNSFRTRGLAVPIADIRIELVAPDETSVWAWGPSDASETVRGSAEDFCLLVTQRRHLDDTGLDVQGPVARAWMDIAQAFAGPPGPGRKAGQFTS